MPQANVKVIFVHIHMPRSSNGPILFRCHQYQTRYKYLTYLLPNAQDISHTRPPLVHQHAPTDHYQCLCQHTSRVYNPSRDTSPSALQLCVSSHQCDLPDLCALRACGCRRMSAADWWRRVDLHCDQFSGDFALQIITSLCMHHKFI